MNQLEAYASKIETCIFLSAQNDSFAYQTLAEREINNLETLFEKQKKDISNDLVNTVCNMSEKINAKFVKTKDIGARIALIKCLNKLEVYKEDIKSGRGLVSESDIKLIADFAETYK